MINGYFGLPWALWTGLALIVAVSCMYLWPRKMARMTTGFRFLVICWGHALTWLLLAINFLLRGINPSLSGAADMIALAGAFVYILFMTTTFVIK